jgi:hypothetical protein
VSVVTSCARLVTVGRFCRPRGAARVIRMTQQTDLLRARRIDDPVGSDSGTDSGRVWQRERLLAALRAERYPGLGPAGGRPGWLRRPRVLARRGRAR